MATSSNPVPVKHAGANGGQVAHPLLNLRQEIDRMFDQFASGWPIGRWSDIDPFKGLTTGLPSALSPEVDISETDAAYEISAELPGIDEKDLEVTLSDDVLTLKGEKKDQREEKQQGYYVSERSYGTFQRVFTLPRDADADKITTQYRQGVLTINQRKPKPRRVRWTLRRARRAVAPLARRPAYRRCRLTGRRCKRI